MANNADRNGKVAYRSFIGRDYSLYERRNKWLATPLPPASLLCPAWPCETACGDSAALKESYQQQRLFFSHFARTFSQIARQATLSLCWRTSPSVRFRDIIKVLRRVYNGKAEIVYVKRFTTWISGSPYTEIAWSLN